MDIQQIRNLIVLVNRPVRQKLHQVVYLVKNSFSIFLIVNFVIIQNIEVPSSFSRWPVYRMEPILKPFRRLAIS